jgi:DNA-binding response OmpR family regulator
MSKIIIVEDDPMISEIYQKKFSESGFEVLKADSGEEVLKLAKKEKVDAILTDLIMPKMDGFEVIRNIRSEGYDPGIKIIVFSNLGQREDREKAMKLGADGFIMKSEHSPSELVAEIKRLIEQFSEQKRNGERIANGNKKVEKDENGNQKGKKILMIEDEEVFIEMFGEKLRQEGFEVISAANGAWGYKEAIKDKFDLFIIDMSMPAMSGLEIVEKLKLEDATKNIPIIMLSASATDEERKKVEGLGIKDFLIKTQVTPLEVYKKVEEILKK